MFATGGGVSLSMRLLGMCLHGSRDIAETKAGDSRSHPCSNGEETDRKEICKESIYSVLV